MDSTTKIARKLGKIPDRYYYQLNGKSAQENYQETIENRRLKTEENFNYTVNIKSEVKIK